MDFFNNYPGLEFTYEHHHIAGMIGNFMVEGRNFITDETTGKTRKVVMDPTAKGDFDEETQTYTAIGIVQWRNDRRKALENFASTRDGLDPLALITQLRFVDWELANDPRARTAFFMTENVEQATMMFMRFYERPKVLEPKSKYANGSAGAMHHEKFFGYPAGWWNERSHEETRLENARAIYNSETQAVLFGRTPGGP